MEVARYVAERRWHPSQREERLLTGALEVTLHVAPEMDCKRWILSWGREVEVLEPKKLREEIRADWLAALRGSGGRREQPTLIPAAPAKARKPHARRRPEGTRMPHAGRAPEAASRKA
jgi:hypothetical protein